MAPIYAIPVVGPSVVGSNVSPGFVGRMLGSCVGRVLGEKEGNVVGVTVGADVTAVTSGRLVTLQTDNGKKALPKGEGGDELEEIRLRGHMTLAES